MDSLPTISILIPVYNVEQYVKRCILSVMAQTYTGKMECIVVDDCGTDKSMAVVEQLIVNYHGNIRFYILRHTHNRGLAAARNTAVEAATGDFIVHIDSDDWVEPTIVEELVRTQQETSADIVSCSAIVHLASKDVIMEEPNYSSKEEMMHNIIRFTLDHVIWRRLIRTSLYKENCIMAYEGVNIGEDYYTLPRLLFYADSFAKCNAALYHYNCINEHSYMQSIKKQSFNSIRYKNDIESINILVNFFKQEDDSYLADLYRLKAWVVYWQFYPVIQLRNNDAYQQVCSDWRTIAIRYKIKPILVGLYHFPAFLCEEVKRFCEWMSRSKE